MLDGNVKVTRVMNAVAAGTTVQNSAVVDMQNFESVKFIATFGALTANQVTSIKAQQDTVLAFNDDPQDLAGTLVGPLADADGNKALTLEIVRPRERFVRCVVNRATANAVIDGVIAIQYGGKKMPLSHDATTVKASKTVAGPAEGTA